MKYLTGVASVLLLLVVLGLVMPNQFRISREIVISAPPAQIHPLVNDLNQWPRWNPWQELDPSVTVTVGEITAGRGAVQHWQDDSGGGQLKFTDSAPDRGIDYLVWFSDSPQPSSASMRYLTQDAGQTRVLWSMDGSIDVPVVGSYLALMMDTMVGPAFELGLSNLKREAEAAR